ncbi:hypothetical protein MTR67_023448 [Solanum verrucosum]|uniref:Uncharacterized protein n=1 Tax=Solanum verrucosum TaxID=315347 RepID=A0AAF0QX43_SOLVR|nr:hypothetical protein MTR67_023448 [Solanum verrucosum]
MVLECQLYPGWRLRA